MIHVIKGDLLKSDCKVIGHQVNCQGVMGAGIAKYVASRYPWAKEQYMDLCRKHSRNPAVLLGKAQVTCIAGGHSTWVVNLFGQVGYGRVGEHTVYPALEAALHEMLGQIPQDYKVGLPYGIGCGLAGGKWEKVGSLIEQVARRYNRDVYLYQLKGGK